MRPKSTIARPWLTPAAALLGAGAGAAWLAARGRASRRAPGVTLGAAAIIWDPLMRLLGFERAVLRPLLALARPHPGDRVLDVGCGTGTLLRAWADAAGDAAGLAGIDLDPAMIARARRKLPGADLRVASATALPYPDGAFDRLLCTFVLHHLDTAGKRAALSEMRRVLRPGGRLLLADFGPPHRPLGRLAAALIPLDALAAGPAALRAERRALRDNLAGRLPALLRAAGFDSTAPLPARRFGLDLTIADCGLRIAD